MSQSLLFKYALLTITIR